MVGEEKLGCKGEKFVKRILLASVFPVCLLLLGCIGSAKNYPVDVVDRKAAFAPDKKPNPFALVVEINEDGKLSLNKIETGRIDDLTVLSEKLEVIFDDREKFGNGEKEITIDPEGKVKGEDLEKLVESLAKVKAAPIRVIKNNL